MSRWIVQALASSLMIVLTVIPSGRAQNHYNRWLRIAEQARQRGDFDTALINYGRAYKEQPNNAAIDQALTELLEERLKRLAQTAPQYVNYIRLADRAYFEGEYEVAIAHYQKALKERPRDYYAQVRIRQSQCIQTTQPATSAQFMVQCPSLFPDR